MQPDKTNFSVGGDTVDGYIYWHPLIDSNKMSQDEYNEVIGEDYSHVVTDQDGNVCQLGWGLEPVEGVTYDPMVHRLPSWFKTRGDN